MDVVRLTRAPSAALVSLALIGGPWGQQAHHFFTLGLEDGSWRVYETATAAFRPPP
jgi:hypothetical protein